MKYSLIIIIVTCFVAVGWQFAAQDRNIEVNILISENGIIQKNLDISIEDQDSHEIKWDDFLLNISLNQIETGAYTLNSILAKGQTDLPQSYTTIIDSSSNLIRGISENIIGQFGEDYYEMKLNIK